MLASLCCAAAFAGEAPLVRDGVTLAYRDDAGALGAETRGKIVETFFSAYLRQRADFNPAAPDRVEIVVDPGYDGIAYVGDGDGRATMTINPAWLVERPGDTDLVAHEAMHIVQAYPDYDSERTPVWLVEGIADYARDRYGLDNAAGGWALPDAVGPEHRYDSGYRVTGAFLEWAEAAHPGLVARLDAALREGRYAPPLWRELAGEDVDRLWARYARERGDDTDPTETTDP
ncbi:basic secretory family protein [Luteimonas sp. Y-2-2-4F]|nr:basic secretory family protein [Luteimonas sp. Y-2-2-4F]MCD9032533.1 basic secretory family protein [Luteimonas sp. Y-2-2-4F]